MWLWTAIDQDTKQWMGFTVGDRTAYTGLKLWQAIAGRLHKVVTIATDYWEAYKDFVPPLKHLQGKGTTSLIESFNSRLRHYLARLHRKTKCYSKSFTMLQLSVHLLILKLNHSPTIFY